MAFRGWPVEAIEFYEGLEADNSKAYWQAHKAAYDDDVLAPMKALLAELEPMFGAGKIFRPYRDVRFSADKTPYKTHIGALLERGGYVQLSSSGLAVGCGVYHPEAPVLARLRTAIADDKTGRELERIVSDLRAKKIELIAHDQLKTVPRGFDKDHPRADLLRYKGLAAWQDWPVAAWLGTAKAKDRVVGFLQTTEPLARWLARATG